MDEADCVGKVVADDDVDMPPDGFDGKPEEDDKDDAAVAAVNQDSNG